MKKFFAIFALIMGIAFTMNAQSYVTDTVAYVDSVLVNVNDTMPAGLITFENGLACQGTTLKFTASNIIPNTYVLGVDVVGKLIDGTDTITAEYCYYVAGYDTCTMYDTMWTEVIDHIDTIEAGHPGVFIYDTIYGYDTILTYIDSTIILEPFFHNDTNAICFINFDTIYNISFVGLLDYGAVQGPAVYEILLTDIYVFNDREELSIGNVSNTNVSVYPNPSTNVFHIDGQYENLRVFNETGQCLITLENVNSVDMSNMPRGVYYFQFDNQASIKVIKY